MIKYHKGNSVLIHGDLGSILLCDNLVVTCEKVPERLGLDPKMFDIFGIVSRPSAVSLPLPAHIANSALRIARKMGKHVLLAEFRVTYL